jgi:hypothetical protein
VGLIIKEDLEACSKDLATSCKVSKSLVAQPGRALPYSSNNEKKEKEALVGLLPYIPLAD